MKKIITIKSCNDCPHLIKACGLNWKNLCKMINNNGYHPVIENIEQIPEWCKLESK